MSQPPRTRGRRSPLTVAAVVVALLAAVVAAFGSSSGPAEDEALGVSYDRDSRVLEFSLASFSGQPVGSAALRGTPVVLNFYASWCTICDRELPDFERVAQRLEGQVHVLGVNPQSNDTDQAQAVMIERNGVTYPTLRDPRDELLRQFNTTGGLPTTVFVDGAGVVRKVHHGLLTEPLLLAEIAASLGVQG